MRPQVEVDTLKLGAVLNQAALGKVDTLNLGLQQGVLNKLFLLTIMKKIMAQALTHPLTVVQSTLTRQTCNR